MAGASPALSDIALGLDVAVAGGVADKFIPGADAHQAAIRPLQQVSGLLHIDQVLRARGEDDVEGAHCRVLVWEPWLDRKPGAFPGRESAVECAYILDPGILVSI